jgi:hypothetical protein
MSAIDKAMIKTAYGVSRRDLDRQKSKHEQKLSPVPTIANIQPIIKKNKITFEPALT